jgi:hypothetical protein
LSFARMVSSNNKIVSSRFFEQSQFEQFTMSRILAMYLWHHLLSPKAGDG